ncbi:hypothetical protein D9M71_726040 [compost metagenome]
MAKIITNVTAMIVKSALNLLLVFLELEYMKPHVRTNASKRMTEAVGVPMFLRKSDSPVTRGTDILSALWIGAEFIVKCFLLVVFSYAEIEYVGRLCVGVIA